MSRRIGGPVLERRRGAPQCRAGSGRGGTVVSEKVLNKIDETVPHSARIWNYWLGGKDNYPVDRAVGDVTSKLLPEIGDIARASRTFLRRGLCFLAGEAGIRQFLDVGTGLPTMDNT